MRVYFLLLLLGYPSLVVYAEGLVPCDGATIACNVCSLIDLVNNVITFIVSFMAVAVFVMFGYVGLVMITSRGDQNIISNAKQSFSKVLIGFIIMFSAWLLVDTVMKVVAGGGTNLGPWNELQCTLYTAPTDNPISDFEGVDVPEEATPVIGVTLCVAREECVNDAGVTAPGEVGNLFIADVGRPIVSLTEGSVVVTQDGLIMIEHADGSILEYTNAISPDVRLKDGDIVRKGQVIGVVENVSRFEMYDLYISDGRTEGVLEMKLQDRDGNFADPVKYITDGKIELVR